MFNLDPQSRIPIYEQIANSIERYVVLGVLKPMEQIPSIRELASTLGINPNTVKKAYEVLESMGIIVSISTKGSFIAENVEHIIDKRVEKSIMEIKGMIDDLTKLGISKTDIMKKLK